MRILIAIQGTYGQRIVDAIEKYGPADWQVHSHTFPTALPAIIDDPDPFLPRELPQVDLLISLGEHQGVAQMIPDIVQRSGATAVIAPADNRTWLLPGLAKQVKTKLERMGVDMVYPVPFCSLAEKDSQNPHIREFARYFGRPELEIDFELENVRSVRVLKHAPCGSTRYVADGLAGIWERDGGEIRAAAPSVSLLSHHGQGPRVRRYLDAPRRADDQAGSRKWNKRDQRLNESIRKEWLEHGINLQVQNEGG
jgi:hypothetical protein